MVRPARMQSQLWEGNRLTRRGKSQKKKPHERTSKIRKKNPPNRFFQKGFKERGIVKQLLAGKHGTGKGNGSGSGAGVGHRPGKKRQAKPRRLQEIKNPNGERKKNRREEMKFSKRPAPGNHFKAEGEGVSKSARTPHANPKGRRLFSRIQTKKKGKGREKKRESKRREKKQWGEPARGKLDFNRHGLLKRRSAIKKSKMWES